MPTADRNFERWSDAAAKAVFARAEHFDSPPQDLLGIKRLPGTADATGLIGFRSEKLRRRVACESGLELRVFSWLERSPEVRWYQEQPLAVPYVFEGQHGLYYPDVAVWDRAGRIVIVEVKPAFMMYRHEALAKATAALNHFRARGFGYLLVDSRGRTIADLATPGYDPEIAEAVESFFPHGPVPFRVVSNSLRLKFGSFEWPAFASMVVNRDWSVSRGPGVRIWKLPEGLSFRPLCA